MKRAVCAAFILTLAGMATAADRLDLSRYQVTANYAIPTLGEMGLEASAVTYARDRNSLFIVGDEGLGVVELSLTGQVKSTMAFSAWPARTTHNDAEGLTYLGNGVLVVGEERLQDAFRFTYVPNGSVDLTTVPWSSAFDADYNNNGMEGLSYDPRNGSFVAVKQSGPQEVRGGALTFEADVDGGSSTMASLFDASRLGLLTLSDVQTLSPVDALAGTPAADNLLILSLRSNRVVEVDRDGNVLSSMDLAGITPNDIEGVTVDHLGTIYLAAEDSGFGNSRLIVLTPVPEPATYGLLLSGLGLLGLRLRRRRLR